MDAGQTRVEDYDVEIMRELAEDVPGHCAHARAAAHDRRADAEGTPAKHGPGGNVAGAAVAGTLTGALGEAYIRLCAEVLRRQAAGRPLSDAELTGFLLETYRRLVARRASPRELDRRT